MGHIKLLIQKVEVVRSVVLKYLKPGHGLQKTPGGHLGHGSDVGIITAIITPRNI